MSMFKNQQNSFILSQCTKHQGDVLMAFENFIITGFKRRQKNINEVENKSQRLRNERQIVESRQFEDHALFLKEELGRYFQQYRKLLVSHGMIPIHRVGITALTKDELRIKEEYNLKDKKRINREGKIGF